VVPIRSGPFTILQIEDDPSDVALTAHALADFSFRVIVAKDGEEALVFLQDGNGFQPRVRPDLILLDLSLPVLNGYDVLRIIKNDDSLRQIPVVIFSTLDTDESRQLAFLHHANSYVAKPMDFTAFTAMIQSIAAYWSKAGGFVVVEPPARDIGLGVDAPDAGIAA
jgi:CheY-like chemotaxis protein